MHSVDLRGNYSWQEMKPTILSKNLFFQDAFRVTLNMFYMIEYVIRMNK